MDFVSGRIYCNDTKAKRTIELTLTDATYLFYMGFKTAALLTPSICQTFHDKLIDTKYKGRFVFADKPKYDVSLDAEFFDMLAGIY